MERVTDEASAQGAVHPGSGPLETLEAETQDNRDDHLRHIICVTCYPAFDGAPEAPQDAVCVCGKRIRRGDKRKPAGTAHCILCDELWAHHSESAHP
jgi:hypothetical protein